MIWLTDWYPPSHPAGRLFPCLENCMPPWLPHRGGCRQHICLLTRVIYLCILSRTLSHAHLFPGFYAGFHALSHAPLPKSLHTNASRHRQRVWLTSCRFRILFQDNVVLLFRVCFIGSVLSTTFRRTFLFRFFSIIKSAVHLSRCSLISERK